MGAYPCQPKVVMSPFGSLTTLSVECKVSNCNCCSLGWAWITFNVLRPTKGAYTAAAFAQA
jgi:hypothetical protein